MHGERKPRIKPYITSGFKRWVEEENPAKELNKGITEIKRIKNFKQQGQLNVSNTIEKLL